MAISNPCFELWAHLHFKILTAHIDRKDLRKLCQQHMPGYEKLLPADTLISLTGTAIENAKTLEAMQERNGKPGANPSTGVHLLIAKLLAERPAR